MRHLLFLLPFLLSPVTSCRTSGTADEISPPVYLTDEHTAALLPTSSFPEEREILQLIEGNYGGTEYIMQTIVILSPDEISAAAFSPLGNSVYNLQYHGGEARYETIMDLPGSSALYMLADIQFCYYPEEDVKTMVEASGLTFEQKPVKGGWRRTIFNGDEPVIIVTRSNNRLEYVNNLRSYEYLIEEQ